MYTVDRNFNWHTIGKNFAVTAKTEYMHNL